MILSTLPSFIDKPNIDFVLKKIFLLTATFLRDKNKLEQSLLLKSCEEDSFIETYKKGLLTLKNTSSSLREEPLDDVSRVFADIERILRNPALCIKKKKKLDLALKDKCIKNNIDIGSEIKKDHHYLYSKPVIWPVSDSIDSVDLVKTGSLLSNVLLERENEFEINTDGKIYTFKGFIGSVAAQVVESQHIFTEFFDSALHGTNMHRIQWRIIMDAALMGILNLRGLTPAKLLKLTVQNRWWEKLFDNLAAQLNENSFPDTGFCSPQTLYSSLLLLHKELPTLNYFIEKSLKQNLHKVQQYNPKLSKLQIYALYTMSNGSFGLFKLQSPDPTKHYEGKKSLYFFERYSRGVFSKTALSTKEPPVVVENEVKDYSPPKGARY